MKIFFLSIVLFALAFCASAQVSTNQPARLKTKITCYEGKIGSVVCTRGVDFAPGNGGIDTGTTPGKEHELKYSFVRQNGDKDVYRFTFTRKAKKDSSNQTTDSKEVQFDGKRIIVFEDELHCVVMESPTAEDLKTAQGR